MLLFFVIFRKLPKVKCFFLLCSFPEHYSTTVYGEAYKILVLIAFFSEICDDITFENSENKTASDNLIKRISILEQHQAEVLSKQSNVEETRNIFKKDIRRLSNT